MQGAVAAAPPAAHQCHPRQCAHPPLTTACPRADPSPSLPAPPQGLAAVLVTRCLAAADGLAEPADKSAAGALRLRLAIQLCRHASAVLAPAAAHPALAGAGTAGTTSAADGAGAAAPPDTPGTLDAASAAAALRELQLAYELLQRARSDSPGTGGAGAGSGDASGPQLARLEGQVSVCVRTFVNLKACTCADLAHC